MPTNTNILIGGRPSRAQLAASTNLRTLIIPWAGFPHETRQLMAEFPHIAVHNLHHNAIPVAEMAVALLLAAMKQIIPMDRALRIADWTPRYRPTPALLLNGKTALILGYGAIGKHVANMCKQFGMNVLATKRHISTLPDKNRPDRSRTDRRQEVVYPPSALHFLLPQSNVIMICLPHTQETDGLIGQEELALMPERAVLVNIGRGPIVQEEALYKALRSGRLHAAGLDVWYNYPADKEERSHTPPSNFPFHELDNVVMSPHRAGSTRETNLLRMEYLAKLLNAAALGQPLSNRVDTAAGY